jgi:ElaB/YqjD/DUF883 family membrane-anchored ribosome-binding protein
MDYNGRIKENIDALREEVATLRKELSGVRDRHGKMNRRAYASGNEKFGQGLNTLRTMSADKIDRAEDRIAERPFLSILVAFLLGILAGKLIERK